MMLDYSGNTNSHRVHHPSSARACAADWCARKRSTAQTYCKRTHLPPSCISRSLQTSRRADRTFRRLRCFATMCASVLHRGNSGPPSKTERRQKRACRIPNRSSTYSPTDNSIRYSMSSADQSLCPLRLHVSRGVQRQRGLSVRCMINTKRSATPFTAIYLLTSTDYAS